MWVGQGLELIITVCMVTCCSTQSRVLAFHGYHDRSADNTCIQGSGEFHATVFWPTGRGHVRLVPVPVCWSLAGHTPRPVVRSLRHHHHLLLYLLRQQWDGWLYDWSPRVLLTYRNVGVDTLIAYVADLNAGLVGLTLTYTLSFVGMFQWTVRHSAEIENQVRWELIYCRDFVSYYKVTL